MTLARDVGDRGHLPPLHNLLINPRFYINQRAAISGANLSSIGDYFLDRWCASVANSAPTWSNGTLTIPAGDGVKQIVEEYNMPGGTYTLSWEGTAQCNVEGLGAAASPITFTVVGGADITCDWGEGTVIRPMLVAGSKPAPFADRQVKEELDLCMRYYEETNIYSVSYASSGTYIQRAIAYYRVTKRAQPSVTVQFLGSSGGATFGGTVANKVDQFVNGISVSGAGIDIAGMVKADAEL